MEQMRAGLVSLMFGNFYEKKLGDFLFVIQSVISVNSLAEEEKKGIMVLFSSLISIFHWSNFYDFNALRLVHDLFLYTLLAMEIFVPLVQVTFSYYPAILLSHRSRSFRDSRSFDSDLTPLLLLLTSTDLFMLY